MTVGKDWKKWFRRDNLLILVLSGVLLFIISLPAKESGRKDGSGDPVEDGGSQGTETSACRETAENAALEYGSGIYAGEAAELEKRLEEVLSEMSGVGKVRVMITLQSSEELVVEKDEALVRSGTNESDSAGGSRVINQADSAPVTVYQTNGSVSEPYVIKTLSPKVEGVVVVAEGAGSGTVNRNITEMVQALFDLEAHKVKVVKMAQAK